MGAAATDFMSFAEEFRASGEPRIDPELFAAALRLQVQGLGRARRRASNYGHRSAGQCAVAGLLTRIAARALGCPPPPPTR